MIGASAREDSFDSCSETRAIRSSRPGAPRSRGATTPCAQGSLKRQTIARGPRPVARRPVGCNALDSWFRPSRVPPAGHLAALGATPGQCSRQPTRCDDDLHDAAGKKRW